MSFVLLILALYAFKFIADQETDIGLQTHYQDIANRIAAAVLGASDIGFTRANSEATQPSTNLLFQQQVRIPAQVSGTLYTIDLNAQRVHVTSDSGSAIHEDTQLFNLHTGCASDTQPVCQLGGTAHSGYGYVRIKYEYKRGTTIGSTCTVAAAPVNCITITN